MKTKRMVILVLVSLILIISGCSKKEKEINDVINNIKEKDKLEIENVIDDDKEEKIKKSITNNKEKREEKNDDIDIELVKGKVTKHIDGDTVHITLDDGEVLKIRMIGIDTPETVHPSKPVEFYGKEASDFTKNSIYEETVYLEKDISDTDKYGRALRYIWLEIPTEINEEAIKAKMFNGILVAQGYANSLSYPPDVKYQDYFTKFQKEARENNLGLWDENKLKEYELSTNEKEETKDEKKEEDKNVTVKENNQNKEVTYIANTNTKKFHKESCSHAKKISENNKAEYNSREEIIGLGYIPCKVCNP